VRAGAGESGKSTIVKQMRILHVDGFDAEFVLDSFFHSPQQQVIAPGEGGEGGVDDIPLPPPMAVRRWHIVSPPIRPSASVHGSKKIVADLRPSADGSAVRTSLVAGDG